jgi:serine/alanine adding enzyme
MGNIILTDPATDSRWDEFVAAHPYGWICHLAGWKKVLEDTFPHMRGYYLVLQDKDAKSIRAALPVFEVKSWITGTRLVSIPYATLSDPLVSSAEDFEKLFDSALALSEQAHASYIQIRSHNSQPLIKDPRIAGTYVYKHHYLQLSEDPERLRKNFHRTCVRQRISRAIKSGLTLRTVDSESSLRDFYRLYVLNRKCLGLPPQPYAFFQSLWQVFFSSGRVSVLLALKGNEPIAGAILLKYKDRVSVEWMVSDSKYRDLSPNHYLFWRAMKSAWNEGFKIFDFGRTSRHNHHLMDFKTRWGTEIVDLPNFYYPSALSTKLAEPESSQRYRLISAVCRKAPLRVTIPIGRFCYRHLG